MAIDIKKLVAAINPDIYCKPELAEEVKEIAKEKGYLKAAEKAELIEEVYMEFNEYEDNSPAYFNPAEKKGLGAPVQRHNLYYDAFGDSLEPIYYWLMDMLQSDPRMQRVDKLVDNFVSSPGSGHFSEIGMKTTKMQEEAMKLLGSANTVLKSILNLIYDLKEFKMRLKLYNKLKSGTPEEKNSAMISLKQLWLDTVDMKRGTTSIKGMAQQYQYVTLIDAFMALKDLKELEKDNKSAIDLNDRVRRILQQRFGEFIDWVDESERELTKRFEIEKLYLQSQINSIKLYARWVKPYLKAAKALEQNAFSGKTDKDATMRAILVGTFNASIMELVLLGQAEAYKLKEDVDAGTLPKSILKAEMRQYFPMALIEMSFRSTPERNQQGGYGFRGRLEADFTSFALNKNEIEILREEAEKDDLQDLFRVMEGITDDSLAQVQADIDSLLGEKKEEEKKKEEKKDDEDSNPFSALFSFFKKEEKKEEKDDKNKVKEIKPDNEYEKIFRSQAIIKARQNIKKVYDNFKKARGMPAM